MKSINLNFLLTDFCLFLRSPNISKFRVWVKGRFQILWVFYLILLSLFALVFASIYFIYGIEVIKEGSIDFSKIAYLQAFLYLVVLSSFLEETTFRLPLSEFKIETFLLSSVLLFFVAYMIYPPLSFVFLFFTIFVTFLLYLRFDKVKNLWNHNFTSVFYVYTLLFVLMHAFTYSFSEFSVFLLLLMLVMHFAVSLLCAYLRVKTNILYSVLLHSFYNLTILNTIIIVWLL